MKKLVCFLSGCLLTGVVMSSTLAFAETTSTIEVVFGKIKLMVNGQLLDYLDSQKFRKKMAHEKKVTTKNSSRILRIKKIRVLFGTNYLHYG